MATRNLGGKVMAFGLLFAACWGATALRSDENKPVADPGKAATPLSTTDREAVRQGLSKFHALIGAWRGTGQPVRNSPRGSWLETADWLWEVKKESLALKYDIKDGKILKSARLTYDPAKQLYSLDATLADKAVRRYSGKLVENRLSLESAADPQGNVHLLTITQLSDKRVVALFQSRPATGSRLTLVAEVGYTRQGTRLAEEGGSGPECIVTGGKGTMSLAYKGQTYFFCCTGCRDAFLADPEGTIAEATRRAAAKKVTKP